MRPTREHATNTGHTYMVTSSTWGRRALFSKDRWALLLIDTLQHYRGIEGGFSYRARKELSSNMEVWQKGFSDHRIRDAEDYLRHVSYIRENPVRKRLCETSSKFPYSSAFGALELDPVPQGVKPASLWETNKVRLEGVPFQSKIASGTAEPTPAAARNKIA